MSGDSFIRAHPDPGFHCDGAAQARVRAESPGAARILSVWLVAMALGAGGAFLASHLLEGADNRTWVILLAFAAPMCGAILYFLRLPKVRCSGCGGEFRKDWVAVQGGQELYLVCKGCRTYVHTGFGRD